MNPTTARSNPDSKPSRRPQHSGERAGRIALCQLEEMYDDIAEARELLLREKIPGDSPASANYEFHVHLVHMRVKLNDIITFARTGKIDT